MRTIMKKIQLKLVVLLIILSAFSASQIFAGSDIQNIFYVSPTGNAENPGTIEQPFKTVEQARDAIRKFNSNMEGDIIVYLREGVYEIERTIEFTQLDSGTNGFRIIYQAYPGENPIISGGIQVMDWEKHEGDIYRAKLEKPDKLRALYVNGNRAVMARKNITALGGYGNHRVRKGEGDWAWASNSGYDGVMYNSTELPQIASPEDLEITTSSTWNLNLLTVRDQMTYGNRQVLLLQQPYGIVAQSFGWGTEFKVSGPQVLHNAYEFLDEPGEFYYDRKTNTVYYYKQSHEDLATAVVIAPMVEGLVSIKGSSLDNRVENISFIGIEFAYSDWNLGKIGDSRGQATLQGPTYVTALGNENWHLDVYRAFDVPGSAIEIKSSKSIFFERCTIKHTGNIGLGMINDVSDSKIVGNKFLDIAGSAIVLGHPQHVYEGDGPEMKHPSGVGIEKEIYPPGVESIPRNIDINNNYVDGAGVLFHGQNALMAFFAEGLRINNNIIKNIPYGPISVGWSWWNFNGDWDSVLPGIPTKNSGKHEINGNRLIEYGTILTDTGAVYLLAAMPGTVVNGNYVVASPKYMLNAIHPDEGTSGVTGKDNVFDIGDMNNFELNDWGKKNDVHFDNTYTTSRNLRLGAPNVSATNLQVHATRFWPIEALKIIESSGLEPEYMDLVPLEDIVFVANGKVGKGVKVPIKLPSDFQGSAWFAPRGTQVFEPRATMTQTDPETFSIYAPTETGSYKLYLLDVEGRVILESKGTLYVSD